MPKPDWFGESIVFAVVNPAPGASALIQPPIGTLWHVLSISANFLADATVINRYLYIAHVNGVSDTGLVCNVTAFVAGASVSWQCSSLHANSPWYILAYVSFPLGPLCYLSNAVFLRLGVLNMQAGDQISSIYVTCERMLEE